MPKFFFNFHDCGEDHADEEGAVFGTPELARAEAIASLAEYVKDKLPDGDERAFAVEVRGADGRLIYAARLTFQGSWAA